MFGNHNNDDNNQDSQQHDQAAADNAAPAEPVTSLPSFQSAPSVPDQSSSPAHDNNGAPAFGSPSSALDDLASSHSSEPEPASSAPSSPAPASDNGDELIDIKQDALEKLSPLIDHLDQTPEEKFRTTMMLIQATDDKTKLKEAYEAAQKISDEKERAQALLDVVNEINYFTNPKQED